MSKLNIILFAVAVLLVTVIILVGTDSAKDLQSAFFDYTAPVLKTGGNFRDQLGAVGEGLKTLEELEAENQQLQVDNRQLRASLQVYEGLKEENDNLRDALGFVRKTKFHLLAGRVVSRDAATWWNNLRVNRGFGDGVEVDMPVITEDGLVGKVVSVSKDLCTVLLVTDENCKVGARIEGTQDRGITQGRRVSSDPVGEIELNFLSKLVTVEAGAKVVSSGVAGGVFPADLKIGEVVSSHPRELDVQAILRPAVDLSSVKDVFIIVR